LNCAGRDAPSTDPCGACPHCLRIARGADIDVIEMDAASNTGVDNIRQNIIDSISYAPSESRFKVYIIDEVHMLSTSAFNALLKTLEEPPPHVKFIFATTEIRKVPVTVLSRCQRFDLRRIEPEDMLALLRRIAEAEGARIDDGALALIVRAAEGSARDATSLLDQAISHGEGTTSAEQVRAMLGLADRGRVLDLFDMILRGDAAAALNELAAQYADGADPVSVLRDLAEVAHWLSVTKVTPDAADDPTLPPDTRARGAAMAGRLSQRVLGRVWQMLLKALEETQTAPNAMMAAEMAVIRMTHVADLPPPEELLRRLAQAPAPGSSAPGVSGPAAPPAGNPGPRAATPLPPAAAFAAPPAPVIRSDGARALAAAQPAVAGLERFARFEDVIGLIRTQRDVRLLIEIEDNLHLVSYAPGRITFRPADRAAPDLAQRLSARLIGWTGARWTISVTTAEAGAPTIAEARSAEAEAKKARARAHPAVAAILAKLPGAEIAAVRTRAEIDAAAAASARPALPDRDPVAGGSADGDDDEGNDDGWDPFDDDTL
ncbi:MAG: DNA polymerase III subunit gamma/tau, partial [Mangrovicoccus sp.]|nr:DNA polymerase III subunit gamma/tau [Mangrovicoccus sp.]